MFFSLAFLSVSARRHGGHSHHHHRDEVPNASGYDILNMAKSRIGCSYVYGATGPNTFDCSGLTQWCHAQFGISIPRTADAQASGGRAGDGSAGDIVAFGSDPYHVGICCGDGNCVHAPGTGRQVKIAGIKYIDSYVRYRRYY